MGFDVREAEKNVQFFSDAIVTHDSNGPGRNCSNILVIAFMGSFPIMIPLTRVIHDTGTEKVLVHEICVHIGLGLKGGRHEQYRERRKAAPYKTCHKQL